MRKGQIVFFKVAIFILLLLAFQIKGFSTHQRAAEITYRQISGLTYEITLISYTFTPSPANAFRDVLTINFGDGTSGDITRIVKDSIAQDITYNKYIGQHSFSAPGFYVLSCEDPNRNLGISNIPNSVNIPLYIYSEIYINPFLGGYNNSPVLLLPPIDNGCVNQLFIHNPGAYDPDGDSLSYRLVTCLGAGGLPIPGYTLPPATDSLKINPVTGDFVWANPPDPGEYNIAILIEEWRNRAKIGSVLRDMQITIIACNNNPPVIAAEDTCIVAGTDLVMQITATDTGSQRITLTGTGEPFRVQENPATLDPDPAIALGSVYTQFEWQTTCNHVKRLPYRVYFKASDNYLPVNLVSIKTINIKVIGPAPQNLTASPLGTSIKLNWDNYTCPNASGYYIYRKSDSTGYVPGYCETGVPGYTGYRKIDQVNDINQTSYTDNDKGPGLVQGIKYCYMIVAYFSDKAESYASNEVCAYLKKDVAVITNVSVNITSSTNGSIYIAWSKPTEIDTIQAPGPYRYLLYRITSLGQTLIDSLSDLNDTTYTDTLLNTLETKYQYRVDLYNITPGNRFMIGPSRTAPSIFLQITPSDRRNILRWNNDTPWRNNLFTIYRKDPGATVFDSVGSSLLPVFRDDTLVNGLEYCYYVKTSGGYSAPGFIDPIINLSQQACAIPVDNVPPCPPQLTVTPNCVLNQNSLTWRLSSSDSCDASISKFYFYYSQGNNNPMQIIDSIPYPGDTVFIHSPGNTIAGCYSMVAVDSVGNRSLSSDTVCIDLSACADYIYRLPDIFTPNADNVNDQFRPFPYTSVDHVNMTIYNRWGVVVFETNDPDIKWDGKAKDSGQPVSDGVYVYVCEVYEVTISGIKPRTLRGSVSILR